MIWKYILIYKIQESLDVYIKELFLYHKFLFIIKNFNDPF